MDRRLMLLGFVGIMGLVLVITTYSQNFKSDIPPDLNELKEKAPPLSDHPFHLSFISEEVCLACHAQKKELPAFGLTAPKIAHEPRVNCVNCHAIPKSG